MKFLAAIFLLLISQRALAEKTLLGLPGNAALVFTAPKMIKLEEVSGDGVYKYTATSLGESDERFNLSIYVEPIDCHYGKSLKDVGRCFNERLDSIPGIKKESDSLRCSRTRCDFLYYTTATSGEKTVWQLHLNALFIYRGAWVDVHFSAVNPKSEDSATFAKFAATLKLEAAR